MRTDEEMLEIVRDKAAIIVRRRRAAILGVLSAIVVLVGALTFALQANGKRQQKVTVADSPSLPVHSASSSASSSASAASTESTESTLESPRSTAAPVPSNRSDPLGDTPHSDDGGPVEMQPHAITSVTMSPTNPVAGELVTFSVTVVNRAMDDLIAFHGDDTLTSHLADTPDGWAVNCTDTSLRQAEQTVQFKTAFRVRGAHHHVIDMGGCSGHGAPQVFWPVDFTVSGDPAPSNGPELPFGTLTPSQVDGSANVTVQALGKDNDGFIDQFTFDWGDGTPPTVVPVTYDGSGGDPCDDNSEWYGNGNSTEQSHLYTTSGTHTVTVTVRSSGCSGAYPQEGTAAVTVQVP